MTRKRRASAAKWSDPDEAPELTADWFRKADLYHGKALVRRGRPRLAAPKRLTSLRLDPDVLAHFRKSGAGWQSRINLALRKAAGLGKR
ncbi:MAG: BrnA antitoxin family protein [Alphaproteobacteria bacterium]|nr:BrnA antitoxin family protein [Alphaproteobacteria bacterium]